VKLYSQLMAAVQDVKQSLVPYQRKLSTHIATRLYRPPEVIILEKHYHKAMDIWSCGVIMGDLFKYLSKPDPSEIPTKRRTLQLFNGGHCFPLSAKKVAFEADGLPTTQGDVLESIFDFLGTPTELDLAFVTDERALAYLKKFQPRPQANWNQLFPNISNEGLLLLR
jgi:mitogen-activated protein kinase 1/3